MFKSKEYEILNSKYKELTRINSSRNFSCEFLSRNNQLENLHKKLEIYKKEHSDYVLKSSRPIASELDLESSVKNLEIKLSRLIKENHRLNTIKSVKSSPRITVNDKKLYEELLREKKLLVKDIESIENSLVGNQSTSRQLHDNFERLENEVVKLKSEAGDCRKIGPNKKYLKLKKNLEVMTTSWKNNVTRLEQKIVEMQEELSSLKENNMKLNAELFKKKQQERLIKMSLQEVSLQKYESNNTLRPDVDHPGISFMYRPSIKTLYSI